MQSEQKQPAEAKGTVDEIELSPEDAKVRQVELMISNLLRVGVIASVVTILVGMTMTFVHHPEYRSSHEALARLIRYAPAAADGTANREVQAAFPTSPGEVLRGLAEFQGRAVVVLGVLLLVATPILRVAASVLAFVYEKDRRFVAITLVVLAFLVLSFCLGRAEG